MALDDRVVVVGGGPAGLLVAGLLRSFDVVVLERSRRLGFPPHCTGIVSPETFRLLGVGWDVVDSVYDCSVFLDDGLVERCSFCGRPLAVRIVRPRLEEELARIAVNRGQRVFLGSSVYSVDFSSRRVFAKSGVFGYGFLVLADGVSGFLSSRIARRRCDVVVGVEVKVRVSRRLGEGVFYTVHGSRFAPGFFAWIAPIGYGREVLIGLAGERPVERLSGFLSFLEKRGFVSVSSIVSRRAGLIARGPPVERVLFEGGSIGVVGDAACAAKPFTGGGLYAVARMAWSLVAGLESSRLWEYSVFWRGFRKELLFQRVSSFAASMLKSSGLWWFLFENACWACREGVDYDRHSSVFSCVLKRLAGFG